MTFLDAVADTLMPGDDVLPPGPAAGVRIDPAAHHAVLAAIAIVSGDEDRFVRADARARASAIGEVERAMPSELAALIFAVAEGYYDSDAVITALGWTAAPPQPNGHPLPAFDPELVSAVRQRERMWRDPAPETVRPATRSSPRGPDRDRPPSPRTGRGPPPS